MKKFYFTLLITLTINIAFSAPIIKAINNGNWGTTSTWNLNRLPASGDTIIINAGKTIVVTNTYNLNGCVYMKVYGTLDFQGNGSTINLENAASVWVFSGGKIDGTSNSQKLRIGNQQVFKGNDIPVIGPQTANSSNNGFISFAEVVLPVKFVGFTATLTNNNAFIQWATAEEMNAHIYQVERSFDGNNWNSIANVNAAGNSSSLNNYSYTDRNVSSKITYYRIKQVDVDGKFTFTAIRTIKNDVKNNNINIASAEGKVLLQFPQEIKGNIVVRFVSLNGNVLDTQNVNQSAGQVVLTAKATMKGNYVVAVTNGSDVNVAKQIIL